MTTGFSTEHVLATSFAISLELRSVCEQYYLVHFPNVKYWELRSEVRKLGASAVFTYYYRKNRHLTAVPTFPKLPSIERATPEEIDAATTLISVRQYCGKVYILIAPAFAFHSKGSVREENLSLQELMDISFQRKHETK